MDGARDRAQLFVGRLHKDVRTRDLEDLFSRYGRMLRCDIKYGGAALAYAFVDYDDKRDAEDAIRNENGRDMLGHRIVVEWAKGPNYRFKPGGGGYREERGGYRDSYSRRRSRSRSRSPRRSRSRSPRRRRRRSPSRSRSPTPKRRRDSKSASRSRSPSNSRSRSGSREKKAMANGND